MKERLEHNSSLLRVPKLRRLLGAGCLGTGIKFVE
jgi:hypothetical protein